MRHAHQRGALCAHNELRNCLYQWQFRARRRRTTLAPPRGVCALSPQTKGVYLAAHLKPLFRTPSVSLSLDSSLKEGAKSFPLGDPAQAVRSILQARKIVDAHAEKARHRNEFGERRLALAEFPQTHDRLSHVQLFGKPDLPQSTLLPKLFQSFAKHAVHAYYFPIILEKILDFPL